MRIQMREIAQRGCWVIFLVGILSAVQGIQRENKWGDRWYGWPAVYRSDPILGIESEHHDVRFTEFSALAAAANLIFLASVVSALVIFVDIVRTRRFSLTTTLVLVFALSISLAILWQAASLSLAPFNRLSFSE